MNGQEIFLGLSYISRKYIEEAETETVSGGAGKAHRIRRPFLLAAVIALLLLLVGCAAVYVLKMEHVKISSGTDQRDYSLVDGVYVKDPHTIDTTTLSMAGLKGSNAYKACADFYAYETELRASASASGDWTGYDDAINAKAQELAEQYGLKPEGQPLTFRTTRNLCDALGVERFVRNSQDVSIDVDQGFCRDSGNFFVLLRFAFPEDQGYEVTYTSGALYWNRQDTFSREYFTLEDRGDWVERNYTTSAGNTVLILTSPSQERGYIICDRGDALMTVWLDVNPELLSEDAGVVSAEYLHMTDAQLDMVADALDFAIQPNVPTQADVDAQAAPPQEATQNGYTLKLKSVETDGYVARVVVGITAPEDVDIESLNISTGRTFFRTPGRDSNGINGDFNDVTDDDGLANTKDLVAEFTDPFLDGLRPLELGAAWNLDITDLYVDQWRPTSRVLTEGDWHFSITIDESCTNYREIELLSEPITLKASTGWRADGTDCLEAFPVTSMKLRSQSISLTADTGENTYADFFCFDRTIACVVLKDGSRVDILNQCLEKPIDLDQADYVLLPGDTKLPVPAAQ
ncbi:MAG: hypothetical protein HPZ81_00915 [Oscillospiraceae bacterium]|nr:hypothetical protein [Oscillospiraceae bacterium]